MEGMSTIRDYMRLFSREFEAEGFQADWALVLVFKHLVARDDWNWSRYHGGVRVGDRERISRAGI